MEDRVISVVFITVGLALVASSFLFFSKGKSMPGWGLMFLALLIGVFSYYRDTVRDSRTHTVIGRMEGVHYQATDYGCDELFKIAIQDCPNGNGYCDHELPYTFAITYPLACPSSSTAENYTVVQVTFVAPQNEDGRPEILRWLNLNWEVSYRSASRCEPVAPLAK